MTETEDMYLTLTVWLYVFWKQNREEALCYFFKYKLSQFRSIISSYEADKMKQKN